MPHFEIKTIDGDVLWDGEAENVKAAVEKAVKVRAYLRGADLSGAYLRGADLSGADLSGADLRRADLSGADLSGAYLRRADLSGADLRGAYLSGADLSGADLSGADLRRADLSGADLRGADLSGADLSGAYLSGAYLRRADLSGADLSGADLRRAKNLNKYRVTPLLALHDQPGAIRYYKLVKANMEGPFNGGVTYAVGESYEVKDADTSEFQNCGAGINLATLDWCMQEWREGYRILLAEFTAADIAAIPVATDGKFRVKRCKIVGEVDLIGIGLVEAGEAEGASESGRSHGGAPLISSASPGQEKS